MKALEQFYQILQVEPARAYYGKNHVAKAAESQAIETLLISDNLFRYGITLLSVLSTIVLEC